MLNVLARLHHAYLSPSERESVFLSLYRQCVQLKASLKPEHNLKAVMLYGPAGAGKTMMVEAIASEVQRGQAVGGSGFGMHETRGSPM